MWKVRETRRIGVKTLYEVYKTDPNGETIVRGRWMYRKEAEALAKKLNEEEGHHECLC